MRPITHLLVGLLLSIYLFFILPFVGILEAIIIFFSSFLIDGDYLIYYIYKKKSISLSGTYSYAKEKGRSYKNLSRINRKKYFRAFRLFHGVETLIILFLLGYFFNDLFYFVIIGVALHLFMDYIYELKHNLRHDKLSIILSYIRFKKLKEVN